MSKQKNDLKVVHLADKSRFEINIDGQVAELDYFLRDNVMSITHTGVPKALEGRGVGSQIVRVALDHAREHNYVVVAICPFVAAYIRRHPEYRDLLK